MSDESFEVTEDDEELTEDDEEVTPKPQPTNTTLSGRTVYILYFEEDSGARECSSIFYTPCEVYQVKKDAERRAKELKEANKHLPAYYTDIQPVKVI